MSQLAMSWYLAVSPCGKFDFFSSFLRQLTLLFQFDNVLYQRNEISSSHLLHLESLEIGWDIIYTLFSGISKDVSVAKDISRA